MRPRIKWQGKQTGSGFHQMHWLIISNLFPADLHIYHFFENLLNHFDQRYYLQYYTLNIYFYCFIFIDVLDKSRHFVFEHHASINWTKMVWQKYKTCGKIALCYSLSKHLSRDKLLKIKLSDMNENYWEISLRDKSILNYWKKIIIIKERLRMRKVIFYLKGQDTK